MNRVFEDDTDRQHCRLDMHKVGNGESAAWWWAKWGDKVESYLLSGDAENDKLREDVTELRDDLRSAEKTSRDRMTAIKDALGHLFKAATTLEDCE